MGFQRPTNVHPQAGLASSSISHEFSEHQVRAPDENLSISLSCRKVNDSVYELHMLSTPPNMDILFFHGLQLEQNLDAHLSTWRSRCADGSIWPKQWLPEDYPNARVLTISYDGSMTKGDTYGRMDMNLVAESLLESLLLSDVGQARPVILIGHSFGGLVIKQLCLHAHNAVHLRLHRPEAENQSRVAFLENIRGIFYYATPHRGTRFTDVELDMKEVECDLVNFVRVFNKDLTRLNQDFQDLRDNHYDWHVAGVGETLPTDLGGGLCYVIVEVVSAVCENFIAVRGDHFSICQPREKMNTTYQRLVCFIHNVQLDFMKNGVTTPEFQAFPENRQTLSNRKIQLQVGLLDSSAGGEILQWLETSPVVGLWGTVGIGKTILSNFKANFEHTLFVKNTRNRRPRNRQRSTCKTSIMDFPENIFIEILRKCPPATLLQASLACKELYAICTSDRLWKTVFQDKWGKLLGQGTYRQWVRSLASKPCQCMTLRLQEGSEAGEERVRNNLQSLIPAESLMRLRLQGDSEDVEEHPRKLSQLLMQTDSFMAWYTALENGHLEFRAQVHNRNYASHGYILSSYDAKVGYDRYTNTFRAKYPRLHGEGEVESDSCGRSEVGISWSRLRACRVDICPWEIYYSDCLHLLKPGDHIEVQWRCKAGDPFGWWYGTVGHTTQCRAAERYRRGLCGCQWDASVRIEFNQYSERSKWQAAVIDRQNHIETGIDGRGFYGGIRKLCNPEEILTWRKHWRHLFLDVIL